MAAPVLSCPVEILQALIEHLPLPDLRRMCLVCKDLRPLVEPFLYSRLSWTWTTTWSTTAKYYEPLHEEVPPIIPFLRTILHRPQLANFVQELILEGHSLDLINYKGGPPELVVDETQIDELVRCIEHMQLPVEEAELWAQGLRRGTMDAFVALLISRLPNLITLSLDKNFTRECQVLGIMLRAALCNPESRSLPIFNSMRKVNLIFGRLLFNIRRLTSFRNTDCVLPLFYFPSIESITTSIENPISFDWPGLLNYPPNPLKLKSLELAMIREGNLGRILSLTREVKSFRWDWLYRPDLHDEFTTPIIDLNRITEELSAIQDTLEELTISAESAIASADPFLPYLDIRGSLSSIVNFQVLKELEVPFPFLIGSSSPRSANPIHGSLPRNLELLSITDDLYGLEDYEWTAASMLMVIQSWLGHWKASTPRLQGLRLRTRNVFTDWDTTASDALRSLCAEAGIQVEIIRSPPL